MADGRFELVLAEPIRDSLVGLLDELAEVIAEPDDPRLRRLASPAYPDDPEREAAYQILAGDELRTSRLASVDTAREALLADELSDEQVWAWLRSLNALRLIVGVELGIEDDDDDPYRLLHDDAAVGADGGGGGGGAGGDAEDDDASRQLTLARIYAFITEIQNWAVLALSDSS